MWQVVGNNRIPGVLSLPTGCDKHSPAKSSSKRPLVIYSNDVLSVQVEQCVQRLSAGSDSRWCRKCESLTSLLVGEDQRVSAATCNLNHSGLQRLDKRQSHRGRLQHVFIALICRDRGSEEAGMWGRVHAAWIFIQVEILKKTLMFNQPTHLNSYQLTVSTVVFNREVVVCTSHPIFRPAAWQQIQWKEKVQCLQTGF